MITKTQLYMERGKLDGQFVRFDRLLSQRPPEKLRNLLKRRIDEVLTKKEYLDPLIDTVEEYLEERQRERERERV